MLASADKTVRIYEVDQTEPSYTLRIPFHNIGCLAFNPDSRLLYVAGRADSIFEVDVYNRAHRRCVVGDGFIRTMQVNKDGSLIVTGDNNGKINVCSTKEFSKLNSYQPFSTAVSSVAFAKDGKTVIVGDRLGRITEISPSGKISQYAKNCLKHGAVGTLKCLYNNDLCVTQGKSLFIYDAYKRIPSTIYDIGETAIFSQAPNERDVFALGTAYGHVHMYDRRSGDIGMSYQLQHQIMAIDAKHDGITVAASFVGGMNILDIRQPEIFLHIADRTKEFSCALAYQPETIPIPEDAIFEEGNVSMSQVWSRRSRNEGSRSISMRIDDVFEEEEDYTENKYTFKRSIFELDTSNRRMTPGKQLLSKSGIQDPTTDEPTVSPRAKKAKPAGPQVVSSMSMLDEGGPEMVHKAALEPASIIAPEIPQSPVMPYSDYLDLKRSMEAEHQDEEQGEQELYNYDNYDFAQDAQPEYYDNYYGNEYVDGNAEPEHTEIEEPEQSQAQDQTQDLNQNPEEVHSTASNRSGSQKSSKSSNSNSSNEKKSVKSKSSHKEEEDVKHSPKQEEEEKNNDEEIKDSFTSDFDEQHEEDVKSPKSDKSSNSPKSSKSSKSREEEEDNKDREEEVNKDKEEEEDSKDKEEEDNKDKMKVEDLSDTGEEDNKEEKRVTIEETPKRTPARPNIQQSPASYRYDTSVVMSLNDDSVPSGSPMGLRDMSISASDLEGLQSSFDGLKDPLAQLAAVADDLRRRLDEVQQRIAAELEQRANANAN